MTDMNERIRALARRAPALGITERLFGEQPRAEQDSDDSDQTDQNGAA